MLTRLQSLFNPLRIKIPFLLDVVIVSDPDQIKQIEASGCVERLHAYDSRSLPWWVRLYFRATKFYDDSRELWFLPFESASDPSYPPRRSYLEKRVATGYTEEDVKSIADLLRSDASDQALAHEMVQVVNRRFFVQDIPLHITKAAKGTLQSVREAVFPWKYVRARACIRQVMDYCEQTLPQGVHLLDSGHNIGEVVQATAKGLRSLKDNLQDPVEEVFTAHPPTPQSTRIVTKPTRFDGLLLLPTSVGQTVVLYNIGKAATKTHDLHFTFGAGGPERLCVFKDFFLAFTHDLQRELSETKPGAPDLAS
jgi:hypothetical protein